VGPRLIGDHEILKQQRFQILITAEGFHAGIGDRRAPVLEGGQLWQVRHDVQSHVAGFHVAAEIERTQVLQLGQSLRADVVDLVLNQRQPLEFPQLADDFDHAVRHVRVG
jgi:hypothetical protein